MSDLSTVERHGASAFLKAANEDSKVNVIQAVKNYRIDMKNEYECPPIGVRPNLASLTFLSFYLSYFIFQAATVCREDGSRSEFYPSMDRYRQAIRNEKGSLFFKTRQMFSFCFCSLQNIAVLTERSKSQKRIFKCPKISLFSNGMYAFPIGQLFIFNVELIVI